MSHENIAIGILVFVFTLAVGWARRMNGGGPPKTEEFVERFLCLSPLFIFGFWIGYVEGVVSLLAIPLIGAGTGQWFLTGQIKFITPEWVDFLIRPFFGRDPRTIGVTEENRKERNADRDILTRLAVTVSDYGRRKLWWRNLCGMMLTGLAPVLPLVSVCLWHGQYIPALYVAAGGLCFGPAHALGQLIVKTEWGKATMYLSEDTAWGEFLGGLLMCLLTYRGFTQWQ